jgi:hypothetical protein
MGEVEYRLATSRGVVHTVLVRGLEVQISDAMAEDRQRKRPWLEYAILLVATFLALELKRQFGLFAHHVFDPEANQAGSAYSLSVAELAQLASVFLACIVHSRTSLPAAPSLERRLYGWHAVDKIYVWRPALIGTALAMAFTAAYSFAISHLGFASKLGSQIHGSSLPQPVLIKLALLYPLAAIGAAISEETVYRFAAFVIFLWLIFLVVPGARLRRTPVLAVAIVLGGLYFGYVHVAEDLETVRTGSLVIDVLTTPQTWAGFVFGYVYCTYGLEAAMVTHVSCDFLAPLVLRAVQLLHA